MSSDEDAFVVAVDAFGTTSCRVYAPRVRAATSLVLAHGAGADQSHPFMTQIAGAIASHGVRVVTFNFLYTEAKRRAPDPAPKLEACYRRVLSEVVRRFDKSHLFCGGKSMGGRIASQVLAGGFGTPVGGLVCLGYPLHPPGKTTVARVDHWERIRRPVFIAQGERDKLGTADEIRHHLHRLGRDARLVCIPEGDHSLAVPKRTGRTHDQVLSGVAASIAGWMTEVVINV